jgi:hypothetical protein
MPLWLSKGFMHSLSSTVVYVAETKLTFKKCFPSTKALTLTGESSTIIKAFI